MKVLVGEFVTESNANIPTICTIKHLVRIVFRKWESVKFLKGTMSR